MIALSSARTGSSIQPLFILAVKVCQICFEPSESFCGGVPHHYTFTSCRVATYTTMESEEQSIMRAMKSAPFVVFAKEAPKSLDDFSMDDAFTYFYFNDVMQKLSGLDPSFLTAGRNAKTDFPEDYEAYFVDDVDASQHCKKTAGRDLCYHVFITRIICSWDMRSQRAKFLTGARW